MMITPATIASALDGAPAWAKLALTAPRETLREDACQEVARHLYTTLYQPVVIDSAQLPLPL